MGPNPWLQNDLGAVAYLLRLGNRFGGPGAIAVMLIRFEAYLDASGKEADQPCVGTAGYVSTFREWLKFSKQWSNVLRGHPRKPAYFHSTEFFAKKGAFFGWGDDEYRSLIFPLVKVMNRFAMQAVGASVDVAAYNELPELRPIMGCPQTFTFIASLEQVAKWLPDHVVNSADQPVAVFSDRDDVPLMREAQDAYLRFRQTHPRGHLFRDQLQFTDKKKVEGIPLQAADTLANRQFRNVKDRLDEQGKILELFAYLLQLAAPDMGRFERPQLEALLAGAIKRDGPYPGLGAHLARRGLALQ